MKLPESINARWIDSLSDKQLQQAERELRTSFAHEESAEKERRGARYSTMHWPASLTSAWMRWSLVSNATRARGLRIRYRR